MENADFNSFDLAAIGIIIVSGFFALRRGLVGEVMALGTWVIAAVFTFSFFPLLRPFMEERIENELLAGAATGLGLFCLAIIVLVPICDFFNDFVKGPTFSSIDRSLGFVFGLVRGFLIACLAFIALTFVWPEEPEDGEDESGQPTWLAEARTKPALNYGVKLLKSLVPEDTDEQIANQLEETRKQAKEAKEKATLLEEMSIPVPSFPDEDSREPAFYEETTRDDLNEFFDRNIKQ